MLQDLHTFGQYLLQKPVPPAENNFTPFKIPT